MTRTITSTTLLFLFVFIVDIYHGNAQGRLKCKDLDGNPVDHGEEYMADPDDRCKTCLCDQGFPTMCRLVSCSPPACPHWVQVKTECCKFNCLNEIPTTTRKPVTNTTDNTVKSTDSLTTLGLRLVASTVTSFLVLALLLFAVHQLRRKRLILAMRRYGDSRRRANPDMYTPDYFGMACPPYEEPPPPYSPPKPQEHPEEAPPPYESVDTNHNISSRVFPQLTPPRRETVTEPSESHEAVIQSIDRNLRHLSRGSSSSQSTGGSNSRNLAGSVNLQWNTLPPPRNHQLHQLQRGMSEGSDLESDHASTDFAITSDSETHSRSNEQEHTDLRQLRLMKLLSPVRTVNTCKSSQVTTSGDNFDLSEGHQSRSSSQNLQSDDHYPDHNLSQNLSQSPIRSKSVAMETINDGNDSSFSQNVKSSKEDCSVV